MATPVFICGAECGIVTIGATGLVPHWNVVYQTSATISTTTVRNGLRSYRFHPSTSQGYLVKTIATTRLVGRLAFRFAILPDADNTQLVWLGNANGSLIFRFDTGAGKIEAIVGTGAAQVCSTVIVIDTWYVLDFDADSSGATATLDWQIDGVPQTQATNVQASSSIISFRMGVHGVNNSADAFYDDIILSYTGADYPFGDGKVLGYSPNVDGVHNFAAGTFKYNAAGANILVGATDVHDYIDERPINNGGDWINQAEIDIDGYVEVGFEDTAETADARGLEVVCSQHSATTSANNAAMNLNDNGTIVGVYALLDISQTSIIYHSKQFATAPSTGVAWTQTRINALLLRWGYSSDAAPDPYLDAVILEIEWAVVVPEVHVMSESPITLVEAALGRYYSYRFTPNVVSTSDGAIKRGWSNRLMVESITIIDSLVKRARSTRVMQEVINIIDSMISVFSGALIKIMAESLSVLENMARVSKLVRIAAEVVSITDAMGGWLYRVVKLGVTVSRMIGRRLGISRLTMSRRGVDRMPTTRVTREEIS